MQGQVTRSQSDPAIFSTLMNVFPARLILFLLLLLVILFTQVSLFFHVHQRHHLAQSMCILNTEGSNIFENLTSKVFTLSYKITYNPVTFSSWFLLFCFKPFEQRFEISKSSPITNPRYLRTDEKIK